VELIVPHCHLDVERNEPAHLTIIARALAEIHGLPVEQIAAITTRNAMRLFWPAEAASH